MADGLQHRAPSPQSSDWHTPTLRPPSPRAYGQCAKLSAALKREQVTCCLVPPDIGSYAACSSSLNDPIAAAVMARCARHVLGDIQDADTDRLDLIDAGHLQVASTRASSKTYLSKSRRKRHRDTGQVLAVHCFTTQGSADAKAYIYTGNDRVPRDHDWCDIAVQ